MNLIKLVTMITLVTALAACGGGGSDSGSTSGNTGSGGNVGGGTGAVDNPAPEPEPDPEPAPEPEPEAKPLSASVLKQPSILKENQENKITLKVDGGEGAYRSEVGTFTNIQGIDLVSIPSVTVNGDVVTVNIDIGSLTQETTIGLGIITRDDADNEVITDLVLPIENTSVIKRIQEAEDWIANGPELIALKEVKTIINKLGMAAKLTQSDFTDKDIDTALFKISKVYEAHDIELSFLFVDDMEYAVGAYKEANIDENEFTNYVMNMQLHFFNSYKPIVEILNDYIASMPSTTDSFTVGELFYSSHGFSLLVGNETVGSYVDEKWVFNSEYAFLEAIAFPETLTCNAE